MDLKIQKKLAYLSLSSVSIEGPPLCNMRFADVIALLGGSEEELPQLTERLEKTAAGYVANPGL